MYEIAVTGLYLLFSKPLLKLASWVFKGSFKKHVEEELQYSFKENITLLSEYITDGFNSSAGPAYLDFRFNIDSVQVDRIFVTEQGLKTNTEIYGASRVYYGL